MFSFKGHQNADSLCYISHGTLGHVDPSQPPHKRRPFASILAIPFVHKIEVLIQADSYRKLKSSLEARFSNAQSARVILPLSALIEGSFFNEYVKKGNIIMLSEGRFGVDNVYSIHEGSTLNNSFYDASITLLGILRLSLDKQTFERAGLEGKPEGAKGKRGARPRWIIEINLRLPSMFPGRKGFSRVVRAFKEVLTTPVTWLFANLSDTVNSAPLDEHFPIAHDAIPVVSESIRVKLPGFEPPCVESAGKDLDFRDFCVDLYEWLALVSLGSPRVKEGDNVDPYLSRYTPPESAEPAADDLPEMVKISWTGFMASSVPHRMLLSLLTDSGHGSWFAYSVCSHADNVAQATKDVTVMRLPGPRNEYISWEIDQR